MRSQYAKDQEDSDEENDGQAEEEEEDSDDELLNELEGDPEVTYLFKLL